MQCSQVIVMFHHVAADVVAEIRPFTMLYHLLGELQLHKCILQTPKHNSIVFAYMHVTVMHHVVHMCMHASMLAFE